MTLENGAEVDVQLDRSFKVVGSEPEDPNEDEGNDGEGDEQD